MTSIELANGQLIDIMENLKEVKKFIDDAYINNREYLDDDSSLYVEYKDGSHYYLHGADEEGAYKKTGIKTVIEDNPCTYTVYGDYELVKVDENEDDENCTWLVR